MNFDAYRNFLLLVALASITYSALHIVSVLQIKEFFAYSSINQYGFVLILFFFEDLYAVYSAFLFYFIYAVSTLTILIFLSHVRCFGRANRGDGDMET